MRRFHRSILSALPAAAVLLGASAATAVPPRVVIPTDSGTFHASPDDATMPVNAPYPQHGFVARQVGAEVAGVNGVSATKQTVKVAPQNHTSEEMGRTLRFNNGGRVRWQLPPAVLSPKTLVVGGRAQPYAMTVALQYRFHQPASQRISGWMPLASMGRLNQAWNLALLLRDGVPVVARKQTNGTLFDLSATAVGHQPTLRVDDGKWHHIAVTFSQTPNPVGCGGKVNATCAGRGWLRLFVDGALQGEFPIDLTSDLRQVDIGSMSIAAGDYAAQPNYLANPKSLLTRGEIADTFVYRHALTMRELSQLAARSRTSMAAQWPEGHPSLYGLTAVDVPGAPNAAQSSPHLGVRATSEPLFQRPGHNPGKGEASGSDPLTSNQWTFTARVSGGTQKWLAQVGTWKNWIGVFKDGNGNLGITCGAGQPSQNSVGSQTQSNVTWFASTAKWAWMRIAIIHDGTKTRVMLNQALRELNCGPMPGVGATFRARAAGAPASEQPSTVASAMLFRRALTMDEVYAYAFPGPQVWVRPDQATGKGLPAVAAWVREAIWWMTKGTSKWPSKGLITTEAGKATVIRASPTTMVAHGQAKPGVMPFTLHMRVTPKKGSYNGYRDIHLATRRSETVSWKYDTDVTLMCDYGGTGCWLYLIVPGTGPGSVSRQYKVQRLMPWNQQARITISFPANGLVSTTDPKKLVTEVAPRVAINGKVENKVTHNGPNHVIDLAKIWKKWGNHIQPTYGPTEKIIWTFGGKPQRNGDSVTIHEVRVYPYAIQGVGGVAARCSEKTCGETGQLCAEATGASALCYGCASGYAPIAGSGNVEVDCRQKVGFYEQCVQDSDCTSGRCDSSTLRCMASGAQKATCDKYCGEHGRQCINTGGYYRCGECKGGFQRLAGYSKMPATHGDLECTWHPTIEDGKPCSNDAQCLSGKCTQDYVPKFRVWRSGEIHSHWGDPNRPEMTKPMYSWSAFTDHDKGSAAPAGSGLAMRCAARDPKFCHEQQRQAGSLWPVYTPECAQADGGTCGKAGGCQPVAAYRCKVHQCVNNYQPRWSILNPATCHNMLHNGMRLNPGSKEARGEQLMGWNHGKYKQLHKAMTTTRFTVHDLKKAVLRDMSNYKSTDYGRLIAAGVGDILFAYASASHADKIKMEQKYGWFGPLKDCNTRGAYTNSNHNTVRCLPKLQPIGGSCPPKGEPAAKKHQFCTTRYCARDTNTCQVGDHPLVEPRPNAGNKDRAGKQDVKFGIVRCDDTTVEMDKKAGTSDKYRYVADLTLAYCLRMFGKYVPPIPVLQGLFHLDRTKDAECSSFQFKAYIAGISVPLGEPKPLFGSCTGMKITNNQACAVGECEKGPLLTGNLSDLAKTLASGAYMTVGGAEPGCLPLDGTPVGELIDKLTILKTKVVGPIPLAVQFGPTLDICVDPLIKVGDTGVPALTIRPSVGLGIDARGGIGLAEGEGKSKAIKFWAGIQLLVDIVKIGFPVGWDMDVVDVPGHFGLWKLQVSQKIGIDLEMFSGSFALFAELALGPFSIGYRVKLFSWTGLLFEWTLSEVPLWSTRLDFQKPRIAPGGITDHDHDNWLSKTKCEGICK